jgi:putative FmdB family regulatory protein
MPFYNYKCKNCSHKFETFHSVNDVLTTCPQCSQETVEKTPSIITSSVKDTHREAAGRRVREYIEETRELLLDSKQNREH